MVVNTVGQRGNKVSPKERKAPGEHITYLFTYSGEIFIFTLLTLALAFLMIYNTYLNITNLVKQLLPSQS